MDQPSIRLIKLTIDIALHHADLCAACAKLPYVLIEDLLESQTIQTAKNIWRIVESWTDSLTHESLFSKGE
ncbi:hypothetical protein EON65_15835 [archaeon]|nr:MAG: hypothetical protein EON65_15835 [archaeon]